jgi:hypothetical protein
MAEPGTIQTVEHGEASALPEVSWTWRRLFAFALTAACLVLLGAIVWQLTAPTVMIPLAKVPGVIEAMRWIAMGLIALLALLTFAYMAGATAMEWVQMMTAFRSTEKITTTTAPTPAPGASSLATQTTAPASEGGATTTSVATAAAPKDPALDR